MASLHELLAILLMVLFSSPAIGITSHSVLVTPTPFFSQLSLLTSCGPGASGLCMMHTVT